MPFSVIDDELAGRLYAGLQTAIPQLHMEAEAEAPAARAFLKHLADYVLGLRPFPDKFNHAIVDIGADAGSFAQFMLRFLDDVAEILHPAFTAMASPHRRAGMDQRLSVALRHFAKAARPCGGVRQFLVG
jgi:D-Tyr-tRNAtyr deacylase